MKQFLILSVALLMLVKPLWPIAEYIMNYDYIVNVLCENKDKPQLNCDGKCYLAKLLAEESEQKKKNPFENKPLKSQTSPILYFADIEDFNFEIEWSSKAKDFSEYPPPLNTLQLIFKIIHPPQLFG